MAQPSLYSATTKLHYHLKPPQPCSPACFSDILKLLCSYGGKIIPRHPDGKLRYVGGETRVLSVHRSISFHELSAKLNELCGTFVALRCQLPNEDLDALVTVTSDEDFANLIEEYDRAAAVGGSLKIRFFLTLPKKHSYPSSIPPLSSSSSSSSGGSHGGPRAMYYHKMNKPAVAYPAVKKVAPTPSYGYPSHYYLANNGNQWR